MVVPPSWNQALGTRRAYRRHFRCLPPEKDYPAKQGALTWLKSLKSLLNDRVVCSEMTISKESDQHITILKPLLTEIGNDEWHPEILRRRV